MHVHTAHLMIDDIYPAFLRNGIAGRVLGTVGKYIRVKYKVINTTKREVERDEEKSYSLTERLIYVIYKMGCKVKVQNTFG
jgi:hypothetical protein